jgi:hypothetical protein
MPRVSSIFVAVANVLMAAVIPLAALASQATMAQVV